MSNIIPLIPRPHGSARWGLLYDAVFGSDSVNSVVFEVWINVIGGVYVNLFIIGLGSGKIRRRKKMRKPACPQGQ